MLRVFVFCAIILSACVHGAEPIPDTFKIPRHLLTTLDTTICASPANLAENAKTPLSLLIRLNSSLYQNGSFYYPPQLYICKHPLSLIARKNELLIVCNNELLGKPVPVTGERLTTEYVLDKNPCSTDPSGATSVPSFCLTFKDKERVLYLVAEDVYQETNTPYNRNNSIGVSYRDLFFLSNILYPGTSKLIPIEKLPKLEKEDIFD